MPTPLMPSPGAGFDQPFELLGACHERVQRSLDLLERLVEHVRAHGADTQAAGAAGDVLRYFDIAAPHHHEDEERHLFRLLAAGEDAALREHVARLRADHLDIERIWHGLRPRLQALADAATPSAAELAALHADAQAFVAIHAGHIALEDTCVFPAARHLLGLRGADALADMGREMAQRRGVSAPARG